MRLLFLISLFLISWKSTAYDYNEEQNIESEQMKIKAIKLPEVKGSLNLCLKSAKNWPIQST